MIPINIEDILTKLETSFSGSIVVFQDVSVRNASREYCTIFDIYSGKNTDSIAGYIGRVYTHAKDTREFIPFVAVLIADPELRKSLFSRHNHCLRWTRRQIGPSQVNPRP